MRLTYEEIIEIMDANAGYLSMDTPENLYKFLTNLFALNRGSIVEFCYNELKYPIVDKLEKIPEDIFFACKSNFNTWTAGSHVIQIDAGAFASCALDTIDLSKAKITKLNDATFGHSFVKKVILPEGLKTIGESTFRGSKLEEVYIPSTVESIGMWSFSKCNNLKKVHLCKDSIEQNKLKIDKDDFAIIKHKVVLY